jgi:hypothetical protein
MKYKIYELVEPDTLNAAEYVNRITRPNDLVVLREPKFDGIQYNEFNSIEEAHNYLLENKYYGYRYSILPYINVPY